MGLALDVGPWSLAVAPEHASGLLLSSTLDLPAPCPNSDSQSHPPPCPLRWLLVPEEDECWLWPGKSWDGGDGPFTLS